MPPAKQELEIGDLVKLKSYCKFSDRLALVTEATSWGSIRISFADGKYPGNCIALKKNLIVQSKIK